MMTLNPLTSTQPVWTPAHSWTSKSKPAAAHREEPWFTVESHSDSGMGDIARLRQYAKTGQMPEPQKKQGLAPGEGTQVATDASAPRETDSELAADVRREYREGLDSAQAARSQGLGYLQDLGAGRHELEDGTRVRVRTGRKGNARVDVLAADGKRTGISFNTENPDRVALTESGKDSRSVRQNGQRVTVEGKGSFTTKKNGNVVKTQTTGFNRNGDPIVETTTVKPNGKAKKVKTGN